MSEYCVVCGTEIPEGRQVCPVCATVAGTVANKEQSTIMTDDEATQASRKMMAVVYEYAARQGGLWCWLKDTDMRLYRVLVSVRRCSTCAPNAVTLLRALDAAGYKLQVVPK